MTNEHKRLTVDLDAKSASEGVITGYASKFGVVDSYGDMVVRGAFAESLKTRAPLMLWQHDQAAPIGVWETVSEDDQGLRVAGRLVRGVKQADEALALLEAGALNGLSIGYRTKEREYNEEGIRKLLAVELYEISLVTIPALDSARVDDVKTAAFSFAPLADYMRHVQLQNLAREMRKARGV